MNLQQLIEMAILDAMGLLDEQERDQFESSFRSASPPVQAQVRREQTRLSRIESLLPDVSAPAGLRAAVIEAVRQQMVLGGVTESDPALPQFMVSRGVSRLWRAAALGLAAASVVLAVTTFRFIGDYSALTQKVSSDTTLKSIVEQFGGADVHAFLFDKDTQRVVFQPETTDFTGEASIFVNPEFKLPKFFYRGPAIAEGRILKLAVVDASDKVVETLAIFNPDGSIQAPTIAQLPKSKARLAILSMERDGSSSVVGRGELPGPAL
jgi:hypothetical protein